MTEWLLEIDPATLNLVMVGGFILIMGVVLLWFLMTRGERDMKDRISRVAMQQRPGERRSRGNPASVILRKNDSSITQLDKAIKQLLPNPAKMRLRLARTGKEISLGVYVLFSLVTAGLALIVMQNVVGLALAPSVLVGLMCGVALPHLFVGFMIKRRKKKFLSNFPDAIDVLVRGLKAGLPAAESMRIIGAEMVGPVSQEFTRITDGLKMGGEFDDILWAAATRIDLPEFNFFVITLTIQRETGGNLGETLENLCDMLRKRRQVKLKVKALSSEAKASAIIIGSLPFALFGILYLLNHEYVMTLFTHPKGPWLIGIGFGMLGTGVGVMAKLVRFEI
jgi:tight adherence protein B